MIPLFKVFMPPSVVAPLEKTLLSGYIGQGSRVAEFEKALAPYYGHQNVVTVNSGTSALNLALRLAGVGPGTETITTPQTCAASNMPILERGGDVVWGDIDPWTGNIDPLDVERKVTPRTRAIIAVHWGGYPCELAELLAVGRRHGIPVIEDAAHAFGSVYRGARIGSHSPFVCFSFQAIKLVTTVDGGALTVASNDDYRRAKLLRWYGMDRETPKTDLRCSEDVKEWGHKYHMNDVAAVIGLEQLAHVEKNLEAHRRNAAAYDEAFEGLRRVKRLRYSRDRLSSYWLYTLRVDDPPSFQEHLTRKGIMASRVHIRNDHYTAFAPYRRVLPGVDEFARHQISIPVGWWLSDEDRTRVIEAVRGWERA